MNKAAKQQQQKTRLLKSSDLIAVVHGEVYGQWGGM